MIEAENDHNSTKKLHATCSDTLDQATTAFDNLKLVNNKCQLDFKLKSDEYDTMKYDNVNLKDEYEMLKLDCENKVEVEQ